MKITRLIILSLILQVILLCMTVTALADLNEGLVAYYPFNGSANDASGNGNDGIVKDAILTSDKNGNLDSAYRFQGYVEVPHHNSLLLDNFTITAWFKMEAVTHALSVIVGKDYNTGYAIGIDSGLHNMSVYVGDHGYYFNESNFFFDTWYHVAVTYDNSTGDTQLFVDGSLIQSGRLPAGGMVSSSYPLGIGRDGRWGDKFNGVIDEVRIYNRALSESDIQKIYDSTNDVACHLYDTNCDWVCGDFELLDAIDDWADGKLEDFELLDLIDFWADGCYHWDSSTEQYRPGCKPDRVIIERLALGGLYAQGTANDINDVGVLTAQGNLVDDDVNTSTGINLSDQFHNLGILVSSSKAVDRLYVYVSKDVTADATLLDKDNWTVAKSNFNLANTWSAVDTLSVTVSTVDAANNIYRYEIEFTAAQNDSFFKAINAQTSDVAGVLVTEIEAYGTD